MKVVTVLGVLLILCVYLAVLVVPNGLQQGIANIQESISLLCDFFKEGTR